MKNENARKDLPDHADSIKQAAAMLGCTPGVLQAAKKAGCPAFRSSRVYLKELEDWLAEHMPESGNESPDDLPPKERLERERLYEQVLTLRLRRSVEAKNHIPKSQVKEDHFRIGSAARAELSRIPSEAGTWEGLSAAELERNARKIVDSICKNLNESLSALYQQ